MKLSFVIWPVITAVLLLRCNSKTTENIEDAELIWNHYSSIHNHFKTNKDVWGNYTLDLAFESMLAYHRHCGKRNFDDTVLMIMDKRNYHPKDTIPYENQPFCSLSFALFESTGDSSYLNGYVHETREMINDARYSSEGAILHQGALLIDYLQEYSSRLAKTGYITGNEEYFKMAVSQYQLYRNILRNPDDGLYAQGRGWIQDDSMALSPGAWSRGHGWLMRGMVTTMQFLPDNSDYFKNMKQFLNELASSLVEVQDEDGMWHQLPGLPFEQSYPETSGTGMIAYYMAIAIMHGWLDDTYRKPTLNAVNGMKDFIGKDGTLYGTCMGPGPLTSLDNYIRNKALPDDHHAAQAFFYALAAECILYSV